MRSWLSAISIAALVFAPGAVAADALQAQPASEQPVPEQFAAQTPSTDGFVHFRLSADLGDDLPALKAQLEKMQDVRIGDPADYELTNIRDFPETLLAVDQHQAEMDWEQGFVGQELLEEHPYELESHPRTVVLGNLVLGDYPEALRQLVARAAIAKILIALGRRGAKDEIETCWEAAAEEGGQVSVQCHAGPYRAPVSDEVSSPDDKRFYDAKILVRNQTDRPRYVALFLVDPAFRTHRLDFASHEKLAQVPPRGSVEAQSPSAGEDELRGRYRLVTIWSDHPFDPNALPSSFTAPSFSASFAEYRNEVMSVGALGGGAPALPGMAAFIAQFYSIVPYKPQDRAEDINKVNERGVREAAHRCGASLIGPELVVTAAHCVAKGQYKGAGLPLLFKSRRVRIGSPHLGTDGTTYAIAGVAIPAEYDADSEANDIALLLLKSDRGSEAQRVKTVAIGRNTPLTGTPLRIYGWGYTGVEDVNGDRDFDVNNVLQRSPFDLQFGNVAALDRNTCSKRMQSNISEGMICTAARRGSAHNVFTCIGDSGGPLVRIIGHHEELVGITSWSKGCGYKDYPDVYTDVTRYRAWIDAARSQLKPGAAIRVPLPNTTNAAPLPTANQN